MSQKSALNFLPSFSKTAFLQTTPQQEYKTVLRVKLRGAKDDNQSTEAMGVCRPTLVKQSIFSSAKDIIMISGVDPDCKNKIKFKSTDVPLPFLYSDDFPVPTTPKPTITQRQAPPKFASIPGPSSGAGVVHERKRPKRDSERKVEVEVIVQPERKRPKREAERRAEALAKQGKR